MIVRQQIVDRRLVANVFEENVERLEQLNGEEAARSLLENSQEKAKHRLFEKETTSGANWSDGLSESETCLLLLEYARVVLVAPYQYFGYRTNRFDEKTLVALRNDAVFR